MSYRKVGGLRFVRIGPLGFSFYLTRKPVHKGTITPGIQRACLAAVADALNDYV